MYIAWRTRIVFFWGLCRSNSVLVCVVLPVIALTQDKNLSFAVFFSLMIPVHFSEVPRLPCSCEHPAIMSHSSFAVHQAWLPPEHLAGALPAVPGGGRVSQDVAAGQRSCGWETAVRDGFFRSCCSAAAARQRWGTWSVGDLLGGSNGVCMGIWPLLWAALVQEEIPSVSLFCWLSATYVYGLRKSPHCR